jgi:hypothetical protein
MLDLYRGASLWRGVRSVIPAAAGIHPASIEADRPLCQRQVDATDVQIDALVYELYGLTDEEISIVEGSG